MLVPCRDQFLRMFVGAKLGVLFTVWVLILASKISKVGRYEMSNSNPKFPFCFSSYME